MQEPNSGQQCAILPSTGTEPHLYFILIKHMLLLAEAAWMHAEVCPLNALMCCENLTGDARRISLARVFARRAKEMQLRHSWNYSRSVVDLWADVMCTSKDMPSQLDTGVHSVQHSIFSGVMQGAQEQLAWPFQFSFERFLTQQDMGFYFFVCWCACFYTFILVP